MEYLMDKSVGEQAVQLGATQSDLIANGMNEL